MKNETLEKLVWALIYVGMAFAMLGLWMLDGEAPLAYGLAVLGGVMIAAGGLLVWVRSRMGKRDAAPGAPR